MDSIHLDLFSSLSSVIRLFVCISVYLPELGRKRIWFPKPLSLVKVYMGVSLQWMDQGSMCLLRNFTMLVHSPLSELGISFQIKVENIVLKLIDSWNACKIKVWRRV